MRSHETPFLLEDGQTVARLVYEPLTARPDRLVRRGRVALPAPGPETVQALQGVALGRNARRFPGVTGGLVAWTPC